MSEAQIVAATPVGRAIAGSVGPPLDNVRVRIAADTHEVQVHGPNVFAGYWQRDEQTQHTFTEDGWLLSGDVGDIDARTGYVRIVGRLKDMIISGGLNVYPKEIENLLDGFEGGFENTGVVRLPSQCIEVFESAIIGVPHPDLGEAVVGVVSVRDGVSITMALEQQMIATLRTTLAGYKSPRRLILQQEQLRAPLCTPQTFTRLFPVCPETPWAKSKRTSFAMRTRQCSCDTSVPPRRFTRIS
jgi:malonyl-CoA/methylmalonyl-CoA synthetase